MALASNGAAMTIEDDPWEGLPRYPLRCYNCGRTHPPCNFYPIMGIMGPGTHGRAMQICNDCDKHLREVVRLRERVKELEAKLGR